MLEKPIPLHPISPTTILSLGEILFVVALKDKGMDEPIPIPAIATAESLINFLRDVFIMNKQRMVSDGERYKITKKNSAQCERLTRAVIYDGTKNNVPVCPTAPNF